MATVAGLISYNAARNSLAITDEEATERALVRAIDYITFNYANRFAAGYTIDDENAQSAIYEAAILEVETPGFFSKTFTPAEQTVLVQVEGIKWQAVGDNKGARGATPVSTKIENLLYGYMTVSFGFGVV